MLRVTGRQWPENFIFQATVDARSAFGTDNLPTSQDVAERLSGQSDGQDEEEDDEEIDSSESDEADADANSDEKDTDSPDSTEEDGDSK